MDEDQFEQGPTGAILRDLPSPYEAHPCGLLHLPRFIAKIRKRLKNELPRSVDFFIVSMLFFKPLPNGKDFSFVTINVANETVGGGNDFTVFK